MLQEEVFPGLGGSVEKAVGSEELYHAFLSGLNIWMGSVCLIRIEQSWSLFFKPMETFSCPLHVQDKGHKGLAWATSRGRQTSDSSEMHGNAVCWGRGVCRVIFKQVWAQPRLTNLRMRMLYLEMAHVFLQLNP